MAARLDRPFNLVHIAWPAIAFAAALGGCASSRSGPGPNSYSADMAKLQAQCDARGGILTPTSRLTGRPETDYACTINGGASRLQP